MASKRPDGIRDYAGPAGGWGALKAQQIVKRGGEALLKSNQPDGFDCPSCAWSDPKHTIGACSAAATALDHEC